jgi:hypothetical protein
MPNYNTPEKEDWVPEKSRYSKIWRAQHTSQVKYTFLSTGYPDDLNSALYVRYSFAELLRALIRAIIAARASSYGAFRVNR